jgi:hypothetical protein
VDSKRRKLIHALHFNWINLIAVNAENKFLEFAGFRVPLLGKKIYYSIKHPDLFGR